jgi:hypothetical protein
MYVETTTAPLFTLKVKPESWPAYLWASYERPELELRGQGLGDASFPAVGFGVERVFRDTALFIELGYVVTSLSLKDQTPKEAIYTELVMEHAYDGRTIPVKKGRYNIHYDIDDGFVGRVGASVDLGSHWKVVAAWKYMNLDRSFGMWDEDGEPTAECHCYWVQSDNADYSAFEVGINYSF